MKTTFDDDPFDWDWYEWEELFSDLDEDPEEDWNIDAYDQYEYMMDHQDDGT